MNGKKKEAQDIFEKSPLSSKKFLVFLISEITWKAVIIMMILLSDIGLMETVIMMAVIITAGFVEAVALGGQAIVDRYVRVARITSGLLGKATGNEDKNEEKDLEIEEPKED